MVAEGIWTMGKLLDRGGLRIQAKHGLPARVILLVLGQE